MQQSRRELIGSQLVKNFPAFFGTWKFIAAFTRARRRSLSLAWSIKFIFHPAYSISILILFSHLRLGLQSCLFPSGFPTKYLYEQLLSPIRATCPSTLVFLIWSNEWHLVRNIDHKAPHYTIITTTTTITTPHYHRYYHTMTIITLTKKYILY